MATPIRKTKESVEVAMTHSKDTKGTRVWTADADDAAITQLYIRKPAANDLPDNIVVKIESA